VPRPPPSTAWNGPDALAALANTYTEAQLALLTDLIRDFRQIVTQYAAGLRDHPASHSGPPSTD